MKKAYTKALKVINSCKTHQHIMGAFNYIWNFERMYGWKKGGLALVKKLHIKCSTKRRIVGELE